MAKSKDPTKTEIKLTVAATILAINLNQLLSQYEALAAKNDHVVSPNMQTGIAHSIAQLSIVLEKKPDLFAISQDIIERLNQFKQQHEQLDA
jgi:septation ring formation regulator EzrA